MAYTAGNLHLRAGAPGDLTYTYDATSDTLATVVAAGYFNNDDDDLNLVADDLIFVQATDGNCWLRVSAVSSGSVTTQFAGGNLPIQSMPATGTAVALAAAMAGVGQYEIGTSIGTATRFALPTPYPGLEIRVQKMDSGSEIFAFDAGGSGATDIYIGNATISQQRRIQLQTEGDMFHVVGVSTSRYRLAGYNINASSVAPAGGSVFLPGT